MIVLIGGSGFIGREISNKLISIGLKFIILDKKILNDLSKFSKLVDINNLDSLEKNIPEKSIIINLAAVHHDNEKKEDYYKVNVEGAKNICEIAIKKKCNKIIFLSSVAVYGFASKFADEKSELKPFNDYGKSKKKAEEVFIKWYQNSNLNNLIIIRPTAVFGINNRGNIYNLLSQIYNGPFFMIGKGENVKSIAYVENLADFLIYCINLNKRLQISNYVDGPQLKLKDLIQNCLLIFNSNKKIKKIPYFLAYFVGLLFDFVSKITNKKFKVSSVRVKKFVSDSSFKANLVGFKPKYSLYDGLKKTIKFEFGKND